MIESSKNLNTDLEYVGNNIILLDRNILLPEDCPISEIQDAFNRAKKIGGKEGIIIDARVERRLDRDLLKMGQHEFRGSRHFIDLAVGACKKVLDPALKRHAAMLQRGYNLATLGQQLWTVAFEEAHHATFVASGKYNGRYITKAESEEGYYNQPMEKEADRDLNNIALKEKFGPEFFYFRKVLYRKPSEKSYFIPN